MPASIFNGDAVKILKNKLRFKDGIEIITDDTDDPTTVAKDAPEGSLYIRGGTDEIYIKSDAGSSTNWTQLSTGGGGGSLEVVNLRHQLGNTTNGGTFTSGSWQTRPINTLDNPLSVTWVSLSANQITLDAGTYTIDAAVIAYEVNQHQARLRNTTDATDVVQGTVELSRTPPQASEPTPSIIKHVFTIAAQKTFEIQHFAATTRASVGYGTPASNGTTEVYLTVNIAKIG